MDCYSSNIQTLRLLLVALYLVASVLAMEFLPLYLSENSSLTSAGNGRGEMLEERDLLRRLDEHPGDDSGVDCTLSLGFPIVGLRESSRKDEGGCSSKVGEVVAPPQQPWSRLREVMLGFNNVKSMQDGFKQGGHAGAGANLVVRRCSACETTQTPLWRNGPNGAKDYDAISCTLSSSYTGTAWIVAYSLCNACGIRFKKEERRASLNGVTNSHPMPKVRLGKSGQEMLWSSQLPKFQLPLNSSTHL